MNKYLKKRKLGPSRPLLLKKARGPPQPLLLTWLFMYSLGSIDFFFKSYSHSLGKYIKQFSEVATFLDFRSTDKWSFARDHPMIIGSFKCPVFKHYNFYTCQGRQFWNRPPNDLSLVVFCHALPTLNLGVVCLPVHC